ncbi:delphilin-like isoform X2 [Mauremys reevesii]|uniref:delphilin-like isoform X2 n=1 Tax=Mauremys reevesii TaxID=260615 RepID=UPI00193FA61E|nr:delphilin-like isoform X2 [Mauremys reevesii]
MGTDETNRSFAAMDNTRTQDTIPQLSQEKILKILNMVKNKELSIEGALDLAQKETHAEKEAMNMAFPMDSQDLLTGSQFNFSVYKYKRYRWQKRILQIDFNTETIFNIEKGIIKKQFPFSQVKSYEDSEGRRFSIAFHGRADYELEAMSLEDKRKISHLVNKVTQSNSYRRPAESCSGRPAKGDVIHEGLLDLQQDSFASIKWVKYLVQLSEGELSLSCIGNNGENKNADPVAKTINLSDGNVSVIKENGYDTFSVQTKEHNYLFRIPFTVQNNRAEDISKLQNEWVSLIDRYCMLWKKRSEPQDGFGEGTSEAVYEKLIISPNKRAEGAHCLAVGSEAPPQSTPFTEQTTPGSSFPLSRVQAVVPPPPSFPPPSRLSPAWKRTKAFHWDVVPQDKIQKSIWASCSQHKKKIDESRIYDQFHIQDMAVFSGNEPSVNRHIMLNQKIAHTFNIFLKSFHIKPNQLKEKLYILHEDGGGLTDEQITALRRYLPTPKDLEMYQSFKGSPSELHVVDQFMLEMCKIPHLGQRLDLLLTIRELPVCIGDLEPLSLLRGKERKITLLHALVEQIFLHEPDLAKFSQELTEFEAVPGASIKGLRAEVDVLKKELENVIQYKKFIKSKTIKATTQESQFYKELKDLIQKYEGHLSQLSKRCDEMKKLYTDTLVKFGESPDQDSQELFGWISAFIKEFRKVSADIMS